MVNKGFSIVEITLVIAVMAVLAGMTAPAFIDFLNLQRVQSEENTLKEIKRAIEIFSEQYSRLPDDQAANNAFCNTPNNTWDECLATVSNLSAGQILTDTWGRPRSYVHMEDNTAVLMGNQVSVHYATVLSSGPDQAADNVAGIATAAAGTFIVFDDATDNDWWANQATLVDSLNDFQALIPANDDLVIKHSDRPTKMKNYEIMLERLKNISEALETFARTKYNEAAILGEANVDKKIFYPPAERLTGPADSLTSYGDQVRALLPAAQFGADRAVYNGATEATRRTEMINLMRVLGLPDSYCCNAMEKILIGGEWVERALYYYSNPRPVIDPAGPVCPGVRAQVTDAAPLYMPLRITTRPYECP
ncbi:MAG: prepilin-type N-terminal cleavage/methylation domain-containing protein [Alphaproteobacteria bacterium]|nr:prepilin-type N-terminal cleavage/methylation domain-containing protein [Alphaproteobacteria bacterium]MDD9919720.1 prepilin-type N-terminal cleavage/methylation domain-containing protein [Alphaproteobacteria bacterium]